MISEEILKKGFKIGTILRESGDDGVRFYKILKRRSAKDAYNSHYFQYTCSYYIDKNSSFIVCEDLFPDETFNTTFISISSANLIVYSVPEGYVKDERFNKIME